MSQPTLSFRQDDLTAICAVGETKDFNQGEIIFQIGSVDRTMIYLLEGEVELLFEGGKGAKTVTAGSFFGELAFILKECARTATARAKTDCRLVILDQSTFDLLIDKNPHLLLTLLRETCAYLLHSEQGLIADLKRKNLELRQTLDYLRRTREELDYSELRAQTDELTGLYNRRCLNLQLNKFIERAVAMDSPLGMIMIDLDHFKEVNDTWGHQRGDRVLQEVADLLRASTRQSDLSCRPGGDEFVILLPNISPQRSLEVAEKIRTAIDQAFPRDRAGIKLTASLGTAIFQHGESGSAFLQRTDSALYRAKEQGRNRVVADQA